MGIRELIRRALTQPQMGADTYGSLPELQNSHGGSFVSGAVRAAKSGFTYPGEVLRGEAPLPEHGRQHWLEEDPGFTRMMDTVGLIELGGGGAAKATGTEDVLGIVPIQTARSMNMKTRLPDDDLFRQAVANSPAASLEDDGLRMALQRRQKPQQHGEQSVRTGVFYLPDGSPSLRYYKNQKGIGTYGGSDLIEGETLLRAPLVAKGATGGKVPEEAYKQLRGDKALQTMRNDSYASVGGKWSGLTQDDSIELVDRFLRHYSPDQADTDMARLIYENSQGGNLLPYAMREQAIAHAARQEGYDSILGIGRSKKGPAFSEVFDVRESHYPSPDGEFELMPQFEGLLPSRRDELARRLRNEEQ